MTRSGTSDAITPKRVAEILWRQKLVCAIVALIILAVGSAVVLTRPKVYQSTSSVALLPVAKNPGILPNYPNLIISLIPTYVQLISSPVLLNQVARKVPFHITEAQLSSDVHAESLSNAAIINIVAESPNPVQAQEIASAATSSFLRQLRGNGVVVPRIYGRPSASDQPAPPRTALLLGAVLVLAVVLGLGAGLLWDRLAGVTAGPGTSAERTRRAPPPDYPAGPAPGERAMTSGTVRPIEPLETVRLRPSSTQTGTSSAPDEAGTSGAPDDTG